MIMFEDRVDVWGLPVLAEDFKTAELKFVAQGADLDAVKKTISAFKAVKDRIKDAGERDIDQWAKKSFEEFSEFVEKLASTKSKTASKKLAKTEGAELIAENDGWLVYKITTHEAAMIYGAGTKWCITQKDGRYWKRYSSSQFYFLISKNQPEPEFDIMNDDYAAELWAKVAVQVGRNGAVTYWDASDKGHESLPKELEGIPAFSKDPKERKTSDGALSAEEIEENFGQEIEEIFNEDSQRQVAAYFDENFPEAAESGQDLRLPYHMKEYSWKSVISRGLFSSHKALLRIMELVPSVDEFARHPKNAYLSWSHSDGMMPYSDANYPDDAVICDVEGIDTDVECYSELSSLLESLGLQEENKDALIECLRENHSVRIRDGEDEFYFYGRHQTVHALYLKSGEIKDLVEEAIREKEISEPEVIAEVRDMVSEMEENAGTYK